jgi:hypothetical protein
MADQPVTVAVFQEFQSKLFSHFRAIDHRFDALEKQMKSGFDEVAGQLDALSHRLLHLEALQKHVDRR